jgi:erythromycin esterase
MEEYSREILARSYPLKDSGDLKELINLLKDKKIVMLGEASHGTAEFYEWRKIISLELLRHYDFDFIAVEGDWPPCQKVNDYLHNNKIQNPFEVLMSFNRWPTWMWANREVAELISEIKSLNMNLNKSIGFYGLDVYSLMESIDEVIKSVTKIDQNLAQEVQKRYACFEPFRHDEKEYARSLFNMPEGCEEMVIENLKILLNYKLSDPSLSPYLFDAIQNARIIKNAESYYRAMVSIDDVSWNVRDRHMMDTFSILLDHYGPRSKGIVWEHNSHIGDYRGTDMVLQGQVNIGGLARERYGEKNVALVGFGTYNGTVIASSSWDGPVKILPVPSARSQSVESIMHDLTSEIASRDFYVLLNGPKKNDPLLEFKGHRAIGVVYHPDFDRRGHYVPTSIVKRYDAFIYLDETHALTPFPVGFDPRKLPESYPFGSRI